jgi:hypothetical protein
MQKPTQARHDSENTPPALGGVKFGRATRDHDAPLQTLYHDLSGADYISTEIDRFGSSLIAGRYCAVQ